MFFPERLSKLDLIILKNDADIVSKEVVKFGEFQVLEIESEKAKRQLLSKNSVEASVTKMMELERRLNFLVSNYDIFSFRAEMGMQKPSGADILSEAELEKTIKEMEAELLAYNQEMENIKRRKSDSNIKIKKLNFFSGMVIDLTKLKDLRYFFAGFGAVPATSYDGFISAMSTIQSEIKKVDSIGEDILVFFAVPVSEKEKVGNILKNVYFHDYGLPFDIDQESKSKLVSYAFDLSNNLDEELWLERSLQKMGQKNKPILIKLKESIQYYISMLKLKGEMAATESIYLVSGWVPEARSAELKASIQQLTNGKCVFMEKSASEAIDKEGLMPPTKFSNPAIFRPFEFLVSTFGVPNYREIDPTPFMAVSYVILYGAMFGDVGHGLVLALIGIIAMLNKQIKVLKNFGAIIFYVGLSAMLFGFLYGEIFGRPGVVQALWFNPTEHIMQILTISIIFGAFVISFSLVLSIINSIREKNLGRLFFSNSGLPGLTFYWSVLGIVLLMLNNVHYSSFFYIIPGAALLLIALEKRLEWMMHKNKHHEGEQEDKPSIVLGFVEVFESLISFVSKTGSFIRVGAFALNHAALMSVVFIIANGQTSPVGKWIAILIGNLFVIGLEGFIVGIQALRLQYYEFFIAFFRANGKKFEGLGIYKTE